MSSVFLDGLTCYILSQDLSLSLELVDLGHLASHFARGELCLSMLWVMGWKTHLPVFMFSSQAW